MIYEKEWNGIGHRTHSLRVELYNSRIYICSSDNGIETAFDPEISLGPQQLEWLTEILLALSEQIKKDCSKSD